MEKQQELEWIEAQNVVLSTNLVYAAKQQLNFLAAVDKNANLYDGPILDHAIYRYKNHWLPLLAKYTNSHFQEGQLVAPLDCEWIWHCHRLNPVRYMKDCIEHYGTILDNKNVVSSVSGSSTSLTKDIWKIMYPNEPYKLNYLTPFAKTKPDAIKTTTYDLVSAVKRQSSFYYQVSRSYMNNEVFLEEAEARYKGFLYLIKKNKKSNIKQFCVPTYDIDLIWHSHQLHPISYHRDSMAILGEILEHDDTDSDRTKGKKLDIGFCETTKCWEETFGSRYLRAGVMYRGSPPNSLVVNDYDSNILAKEYVEVFVEIVEAKNLPAGHSEGLFVSITKNQIDHFFNSKRIINIVAEPKEKQIVAFECEPNGEILFELVSTTPCKILGTTLISFDELSNRISTLSLEKWYELKSDLENKSSDRTSIRIAISFTPPIQAEGDKIKKNYQALENGLEIKNIYNHKGWSKGGNCGGSGGCGGSCSGGSRCGGDCGGSCRGGGCRNK